MEVNCPRRRRSPLMEHCDRGQNSLKLNYSPLPPGQFLVFYVLPICINPIHIFFPYPNFVWIFKIFKIFEYLKEGNVTLANALIYCTGIHLKLLHMPSSVTFIIVWLYLRLECGPFNPAYKYRWENLVSRVCCVLPSNNFNKLEVTD